MLDKVIIWVLYISVAALLFTVWWVTPVRPNPLLHAVADAPMPAKVVLVACKTVRKAGPPDPNSVWTGYENREWATEYGMMHCRRFELQLEHSSDPTEAFTPQKCSRAASMMGVAWDMAHKRSSYRAWRILCPVPVRNIDGEIIEWRMPECPHRNIVICENDLEI